MRTMKILGAVTIAGALIALAGCSSTAPATTQVPIPTPTIEAATTQQVASVLAGYEPEWREVVENATSCRVTWLLDDSPTGQLKGSSCFLKEKTLGITAQLVLRDWSNLAIPSSMQALVDETSQVLQQIADVDIAKECGDEFSPTDTEECSSALGARNTLYLALERSLNKWSPYL